MSCFEVKLSTELWYLFPFHSEDVSDHYQQNLVFFIYFFLTNHIMHLWDVWVPAYRSEFSQHIPSKDIVIGTWEIKKKKKEVVIFSLQSNGFWWKGLVIHLFIVIKYWSSVYYVPTLKVSARNIMVYLLNLTNSL